jgi:hypothetical protein
MQTSVNEDHGVSVDKIEKYSDFRADTENPVCINGLENWLIFIRDDVLDVFAANNQAEREALVDRKA